MQETSPYGQLPCSPIPKAQLPSDIDTPVDDPARVTFRRTSQYPRSRQARLGVSKEAAASPLRATCLTQESGFEPAAYAHANGQTSYLIPNSTQNESNAQWSSDSKRQHRVRRIPVFTKLASAHPPLPSDLVRILISSRPITSILRPFFAYDMHNGLARHAGSNIVDRLNPCAKLRGIGIEVGAGSALDVRIGRKGNRSR